MHYGVFTGINNYMRYPDSQLRGCVNDANHLAEFFKCNSKVMLLDKDATKAAIVNALNNIVLWAKSGDHVIYTHSSHGADEGLCCHDLNEGSNGWDMNTLLTSKEIAAILKRLPEGVTAEVLIDACHSPSQMREIGKIYGVAKYMMLTGGVVSEKPRRQYFVTENAVLWCACEPEQTSADAYIDREFQGAFTAAFLKFATPGRCRSDIIYYARDWLAKQRFAQRPHLYSWHDKAMENLI